MECLLPDGRVRVSIVPHGRDQSLRTPLRGAWFRRQDLNPGFETGLINFINPYTSPVSGKECWVRKMGLWASGYLTSWLPPTGPP